LAEIAGVKILYTGDFSREEDRHLMSAEIPSVRFVLGFIRNETVSQDLGFYLSVVLIESSLSACLISCQQRFPPSGLSWDSSVMRQSLKIWVLSCCFD